MSVQTLLLDMGLDKSYYAIFCGGSGLISPLLDLFEPKMTRKLRRRHLDPLPNQDKRRKSSPHILITHVCTFCS